MGFDLVDSLFLVPFFFMMAMEVEYK